MNIIFFETIDSTNCYAKKNIDKLKDKDIILANKQTNGRGRFERPWTDLGAENVYMTVILKPSKKMSEIYSNLTQYMSVRVCSELEQLGLKPQIKWPNDILLNNKKVCGILAESITKNGELKGIALGLGINLNATRINVSQLEKPATSVNLELGENVDRKQFILNLLEKFFKDYDEFLMKGFVFIKEDYTKRIYFSENTIKINGLKTFEQGIASGIDSSGALLLKDTLGNTKRILMGEIVS